MFYQASLMRGSRKDGFEEGMKNEKYSIAKNLKKSGLDIKFISENTGLPIEEIEKL